MKVKATPACLLLVAVPLASASVLRSKEKGFFDVLAGAALEAASGAVQGFQGAVQGANILPGLIPVAQAPAPAAPRPSLNLPELNEGRRATYATLLLAT